ncbi:hypothetical protein BGZ93_007827 [Podila epicladia]|nr:hypothetical protein BGZ93_007827 [Podila epicladia]
MASDLRFHIKHAVREVRDGQFVLQLTAKRKTSTDTLTSALSSLDGSTLSTTLDLPKSKHSLFEDSVKKLWMATGQSSSTNKVEKPNRTDTQPRSQRLKPPLGLSRPPSEATFGAVETPISTIKPLTCTLKTSSCTIGTHTCSIKTSTWAVYTHHSTVKTPYWSTGTRF